MSTRSTNRSDSSLQPDHTRAEKLRRLFRRSARFLAVHAAEDPCAKEPSLLGSSFFSRVQGREYFVESRIGFGPDSTALVFFVTAAPIDGVVPNVLLQFSPQGAVKGVVETSLSPSEEKGIFSPTEAIPLAPHHTDVFQEVLAEKVADQIIDDLLTRSKECRLEKRPAYLR
jgi:hypothetical protein